MEDLTKNLADLDYNLENDLLQRGFVVDYEKGDEHITYRNGGIYVRIVYDTYHVDNNGVPDYFRIYNLNQHGQNYYAGKRPSNSIQLNNIFNNVYLDNFINN